ncbi:indoleamine 2,3-dioxygenase 2 [Exaiptasia diaphana]|uniref:Indoleamine 2,3-dioxygenase n=1 Tax=Exaiptasia diaphana TaxID=2652724 RepID=A0A913XCM2_EXADI|nr:indoleamine 2,3-dioxygenase 2 [Exaiptasia diaphana]KXJ13337.1 Indoleamine 2,3-dioxygenase 2 [Exaiptasia diaphana]
MDGRKLIQLEDYDISPSMGFLLERPLLRLPEYFSPWEKVCDDIPQMIKDGMNARDIMEKLPLLDHSLLSSKEEWYRANLLLITMAHTFVWCQGENEAAKVLPKNIAVPMFSVARHLDMHPVLTHFSQTNCNWRKIGPNESDIELINTITGTKTEQGFFKTGFLVELAFGKGGPKALIKAQQAAFDDDVLQLIDAMKVIHHVIENMKSAFLKVHEMCDPKEYYFVLRPFLSGWGHKGSSLPDGLIYEGVDTKPKKYSGGSAAQCSAFPAIEAILGVTHATENGEEHHLQKMRRYMPPKHRDFITVLENGPSVREYVLKKENQDLTEIFNQSVEALQEFRNAHMRVVARYIISQANRSKEAMGKNAFGSYGTAGADLFSFFKKIRNETAETKLN